MNFFTNTRKEKHIINLGSENPKGLNIPLTMDIPVELEQKLNTEVDLEIYLEKQRDKRIEITFNNSTSNLKRVADYLWIHINKEISYKEISEALGIPEGSVKVCITDLNSYRGFPITMIPVPKKKGYIQSVLNNDEDYSKWDLKKTKTITTMKMVKGKAERITSSKKKVRKQQKVRNKEIIVEQELEQKQKS